MQPDFSLQFYLVWLPKEWHILLFFGLACFLVPLFPCSKAKEVPFFIVFTARCHQIMTDVKISPAYYLHTFSTTFIQVILNFIHDLYDNLNFFVKRHQKIERLQIFSRPVSTLGPEHCQCCLVGEDGAHHMEV